MGVNWNNVVIAGAKLDPELNKYDEDKDESTVEKIRFSSRKPELNKLVALTDPMSGDYFIVGHLLAATKDGREDMADFGSKPIELSLTGEQREKIAKEISEFPGLTTVSWQDVKLYALTEYT
jgi:hypothetical protein